ncbi:MAG: hypothetical protein LUC22_07005 [Prevotella sp.]|nr:hypothetical protein [Prevotella sp.]
MKAVYAIMFLMLCVFSVRAQETNEEVMSVSADNEDGGEYLNGMVPVAVYTPDDNSLPDSLSVPMPDCDGYGVPRYRRPGLPVGGGTTYGLHDGLNASLDLSAFTSFGKHHLSGTAERISLMYAAQLNDNLSVAVGGYLSNLNSSAGSFRTAGIYAMLNYRFNEHWEAYVYGQKNLMYNNTGNRFGLWSGIDAYDYYGNFADRLGLGLRYNFNETTFLEVQFDFERYPNDFHQRLVNRSFDR